MSNKTEQKGIKAALTSGIWYTASSIIVKGATMLLAPIYTRIMTLAEYGFNATISVWISVLSTIATGNLSSSVYRAKYEFKDRFEEYISSIAFLGSLITVACYVIVMLFSVFFCNLFGCRIEYFHLIFGSLLVAPAMSIFQDKNRLENKYKLVTALTIGVWFISSTFNILALVSESFRTIFFRPYSNDRIFSMYIANTIPNFLVNITIYIILISRGKVFYNREFWNFALAMSLPLIPHALSIAILTSSDKVMITKMCGEEQTALYSITYTCSTIISMLFNALNQAWVPWFNDEYYHNNKNQIHNVTKVYYSIFFIITIGIMLISPEILLIFGGEKYKPAMGIMPIVMFSCFIQFNNAFFVNVETFEKKTVFVAIGTLIAAMINIGLNFILIPKYGYYAAAYTTLISQGFLFVFHFIVNRQLIGKEVGQMYPLTQIFISLSVIAALIVPLLISYEKTVLRILMIVGYVVLLVIFGIKNYGEIKALLSTIVKNDKNNVCKD